MIFFYCDEEVFFCFISLRVIQSLHFDEIKRKSCLIFITFIQPPFNNSCCLIEDWTLMDMTGSIYHLRLSS